MRASVLIGLLFATLVPTRSLASTALLFAFDTSGSLRPSDLDRARALVREFLADIDDSTSVAVLTFDDRPRLVVPFGSIRPEIDRALDAIAIGGTHTALHDALWDASRVLGEAGAERRAVILLTDGHDENSALLFEDAERAVVENRATVFAIGCGSRVDEKFMRRFVKLTSGAYFPAHSLADVAALKHEITRVLVALPVAPSPTAQPTLPAMPEPTPGPAPQIGEVTPVPVKEAPVELPTPLESDSEPAKAQWLAVALATVLVLIGWLVLRRRPGVVVRSPTGTTLAAPRPSFVAATSGPEARFATGEKLEEDDELDPLATTANLSAEEVAAVVGGGVPEPSVPRAGLLDRTAAFPRDEFDQTLDAPGESVERTFLLVEQAVLVIKRGRTQGARYLLDRHGDLHIGRAKINEIVLDDRSVSSRHVRIRSEGMIVTALDLGSTNGSFLNDRPLTGEMPLEPGDSLRIGETEIEFRREQRRPGTV